MRLPNPLLLAATLRPFGALPRLHPALADASSFHDRRSLILLWTVIIVSLWLGIQMVWLFRAQPSRIRADFIFSASSYF